VQQIHIPNVDSQFEDIPAGLAEDFPLWPFSTIFSAFESPSFGPTSLSIAKSLSNEPATPHRVKQSECLDEKHTSGGEKSFTEVGKLNTASVGSIKAEQLSIPGTCGSVAPELVDRHDSDESSAHISDSSIADENDSEITDYSDETPLSSDYILRNFGLEVATLVLLEVWNRINPKNGPTSCAGPPSQSSSGATSSKASKDSHSQSPNKKRSRAMTGKGFRNDAEQDGDDDQEEDHPKRPRKTPPSGALARVRLRKFACPFFKRNPDKHQRWRSCAGPGWETVHRVK
jgi:hypothetical protein